MEKEKLQSIAKDLREALHLPRTTKVERDVQTEVEEIYRYYYPSTKTLETVDELIDHLIGLGRGRVLIVDVDGNTFPPTKDDIGLWSPEDENSPVAIMTHNWIS